MLVLCLVSILMSFQSLQAAESETLLVVPHQRQGMGTLWFRKVYGESPYQLILTDRDKAPENSTGDIVKALRENSSVRLVCYDKSASDCLEALLQYENLQKKVKEFVALNGKVRGAEFAERAKTTRQPIDLQKAEKAPLATALHLLKEEALKIWKNVPQGHYAMNPVVRTQYLQANKKQILKLSQQVPLVSVDDTRKKYGVLPHSLVKEIPRFED